MAKVIKGPWGRRQAKHPIWAPLWEELCRTAELPSLGQEGVIAKIVAEILDLVDRLNLGPILDASAWLRGFIRKMDKVEWPPDHPQDYNNVLGALKVRKTQLQKMERRELSLISIPQVRMIWGCLRRHHVLDEDWLYAYIAENFPEAKREKHGHKQPSLSSLTNTEAGHIIDVIRGKAQPRGKHDAA